MQRVAYPSTAATGLTVFDTDPTGEAAADFVILKNELTQLLK